eukprot:4298319-Amphidinium_carterae.1
MFSIRKYPSHYGSFILTKLSALGDLIHHLKHSICYRLLGCTFNRHKPWNQGSRVVLKANSQAGN